MSDRRTRFPWVKLGRPFLEAQASNGLVPEWQRVAFAGWANVDHRGVARFAPGDLDWLVAPNWGSDAKLRVDLETGELLNAPRLTRSIAEAVRHGWLGEGSTPELLRVPHDVVSVGRVFGKLPWVKLHRELIEAAMIDRSLPDWQRVTFAGLAHLTPQGVAHLEAGELEAITGARVRRALGQGKLAGWIGVESTVERVHLQLAADVGHAGQSFQAAALAA